MGGIKRWRRSNLTVSGWKHAATRLIERRLQTADPKACFSNPKSVVLMLLDGPEISWCPADSYFKPLVARFHYGPGWRPSPGILCLVRIRQACIPHSAAWTSQKAQLCSA